MLKLLIEDSEGNSKVTPIEPDKMEITIGRKEGNFIRLKEQNVSRYHAKIYSTPEGMMIAPVAARYGLKVNSTKIDGPTPINTGDEIHIGDYRLYIQDDNTPDIRKQKEEALASVVPIPPVNQPRLVVVSSNYAGQEYRVTQTKVTLGRSPECDIRIEHGSVSGHQAEIHKTIYGDFEIVDLKSSNGTIVNGQMISTPVRLASGDFIVFGHVAMRYCAPGDFWSLSYGMSSQPKRNTALFMVVLIVAIAAAIVLTFALTSKFMSKQHDNVSTNNNITKEELRTSQQSNQLLSLIMSADDAIRDGELSKAKAYLDDAVQIDPEDARLKAALDRLSTELDSKAALDNVESSLAAKNCREAMTELENIKERTWAKDQADKKHLIDEVSNCMDAVYLSRAMASIERGDYPDAELARDEIKRTNQYSPNIAKIDEAIKAKKAQESKNSKSADGSSAKDSNSGAAANAPKQESESSKNKMSDEDFQKLVEEMESAPLKSKPPIAEKIVKIKKNHPQANCVLAQRDFLSAKVKPDEADKQKHACRAYKYYENAGEDCPGLKIDASLIKYKDKENCN